MLLGWDKTMAEAQGVTLAKDMFKTPNHKAMELITYFLLHRLTPARTAEVHTISFNLMNYFAGVSLGVANHKQKSSLRIQEVGVCKVTAIRTQG